jgi:choline/glycine/proline betaine transport protein
MSSRHSDWLERALARMNPPVFLGSAAAAVAFVALGTLATDTALPLFRALQESIVDSLGWLYVSTATALLLFALYVGLGPYRAIRLGGEGSEPEFGTATWLAMLLAAGMGIGIVFFGAAEPVEHFLGAPSRLPGPGEGAVRALRITYHHWGLHAWGIYATFAMALAYFHFRHELPLAPRSLLYPLIGRRIDGWIGHGVDILCTVGTLFGVATSLGLGSAQIASGLGMLFGWPASTALQLALIGGITAIATISVVSGLHVGVRLLSRSNMLLAAILLVFVLVTGPTVYILDLFVASVGAYLQALPALSLWTDPGASGDWQARWTLFYWSWWISWSPFVGVFVARISRGRTLREFVLGALIVPSLVSFLWFAAVGGSAIHAAQAKTDAGATGLLERIAGDASLSFFLVLDVLPWAGITQVAATLLVLVFFVTSSDSGSLVDDMVTSGGHPDPPRAQRVFWAVAEGAVAATLVLAGGLEALRMASLTTGVPLALFLLVASFGLLRALRRDQAIPGVPDREVLRQTGD